MIRYATVTNNGSREINEDSIGVFSKDDMCLFVLCDGLGGHGMGDVASSLVVDVFGSQFEQCNNSSSFLEDTFIAAQGMLMSEQSARHVKQKMKTTCVALLIDDKKARIGHVGDSRLYVFKNGKYKSRTLDHSIPQMLVLSREIKESEIRNHPQRSYVTKVMGIEWEQPMFDLMTPLGLKDGMGFLLCSDGFWELIDEDMMCSMMRESSSPEEWLKEMENCIIEVGKDRNMDNYSAIAVWVEKE